MLSIGDGVAIATVVLTIGGVLIKVLPARGGFCNEHHYMSKTLRELKDDVKRMNEGLHTKINSVAQNVAVLCGALGVKPNKEGL